MTDAAAPTGTELTTPATPTRVARDYRVVESRLGIMDTARFEHLGRVAAVLARAGLLPESLTHTGPSTKREELPYEVIQARAFLIANQADLLEIDPNALAQCTSFVHGKLMYEGKLVHAVISAKLGVDLDYQFGTYDISKRDILGEYKTDPETGRQVWHGKMPENANDQALGVRVVGTLPGETEPRWIAGSVGMWHKGDKSPWSSIAAWPRQLRYMGSREWARAYKPGLMLGILADDEVDEYELGRQVGQIAPAAPQLLSSGFSDTRVSTPESAPADPKPRKKATKAAEQAPPAAEEANTEPTGPEEVATPSTPSGNDEVKDEEVASTEEGEPTDEITEGYPADGEIYHLTGDAWGSAGRRDTYKDGKPFSTAFKEKGLAIYEDHAPAAEESGLPPEFAAYVDAVEEVTAWVDVKKAMQAFYTSDLFKKMPLDEQNKVRANTWDACIDEEKRKIVDLPKPSADASAFRLFIQWSDDPELIQATLDDLEKFEGFASKDDGFKTVIRNAAASRIEELIA